MSKALPEAFNKYFWDTNTSNISVSQNSAYIIGRLFELGDIEALNWLNSTYDKGVIVKTLQESRIISPKTGNFYALYYKVPKESLACMKKRYI
jgi:hypothetical protein